MNAENRKGKRMLGMDKVNRLRKWVKGVKKGTELARTSRLGGVEGRGYRDG